MPGLLLAGQTFLPVGQLTLGLGRRKVHLFDFTGAYS